MLGISAGGRRVYELIVLRCSRSGEHVIDGMSTSLGFWRGQQEGQKNWRGRVQCILEGLGTYNSRRTLLLFVVYGLEVLAERGKQLLTWIASNQKYRWGYREE